MVSVRGTGTRAGEYRGGMVTGCGWGSSIGSWSSTRWCSAWSSGLGSIPSSCRSRDRSRRYVDSATAGRRSRYAAHIAAPPLHIEADSTIPVGRGLGSSAAACVAGALAANELLALGFDADAIVNVAANIEGHPDNVAPAVHGGAVLGVRTAAVHDAATTGAWYVAPLRVDPSLRLAFAIPDFEIATRAARSVLPRDVEFATAVDAAARAAALVAGLASGDHSLLRAGFDDVLHVPHRRALIPGYDAVVAAAIAHGAYGATLSGSGSSIVAVAAPSSAAAVATAMCDAWREIGVVATTLVSAGEVPGATVTRAHS